MAAPKAQQPSYQANINGVQMAAPKTPQLSYKAKIKGQDGCS